MLLLILMNYFEQRSEEYFFIIKKRYVLLIENCKRFWIDKSFFVLFLEKALAGGAQNIKL